MAKTDKELAVELAATYIQAWSASPKTSVLTVKNAQDIVKALYETIHTLPEN